MTYQSIPKFNTTLNGHPVFIPAMLWHLPAHTLPQAIEALRTINKKSFGDFGVCLAASKALNADICINSENVYSWIGPAVCYFDHTKQRVEENWLEQYFHHRFGLCGERTSTSVEHYSREQNTALRLAWLEHIIAHLEKANHER